MWETWVQSLGWEDPLEKGKATHSSILAWRIPWTVKFMGSQRVGHEWATFTALCKNHGITCVLQFMGLQRVRHDWATELNWTYLSLSEATIQHGPHTVSLKYCVCLGSHSEHWWTLTAEAIRLAFCYPHHEYLSLKPLFCLCLRYQYCKLHLEKCISLNLMYFENEEHSHLCIFSDRLKPSHGCLLEMQNRRPHVRSAALESAF